VCRFIKWNHRDVRTDCRPAANATCGRKAAAKALAARFGNGTIDGKIQAIVFEARK
jgi:hypothetical protein